MLGYEFLYQNFSFLQVHDLQVLSSRKSWDEAIVEVLQMDPQVLTQDLAKYIYDETR
jgi:hypothetical protein